MRGSGMDKHRDEMMIVSKEDWSLHRKGHDDQRRHKEKVQEVIQKNLPDLITEENIIQSKGDEIVKIPIRSLDEYKIRYNHNQQKHVGQGDGDSEIGDVIARDKAKSKQSGRNGAGSEDGVDYYEAEVSFAEIEEELFRDFELPRLKDKEKQDLEVTHIEYNDIRKTGLTGNIDKKRTMLSAFKRNALHGNEGFYPIYPEDLKFKTWNEKNEKQSSAVIIAMLDTSGSMGFFEKYVSRSFFFWMVRFLKKNYENVKIEYIAHHTKAKLVTEEEFFSKGESGGTICSSAYIEALKLIKEKYPATHYNIYPFHFSDGDNLTSDNDKCLKLIEEILQHVNVFGYCEVNQYNRSTTLMSAYKHIKNENFSYFVLNKRADVFYALKSFFSNEDAEANSGNV